MKETEEVEFIAHFCQTDGKGQSVKEHLESVADLCRANAAKIDCGDYGEILGLLHDLGKYSSAFQDYIKSAVGLLDPDTDGDYVNATGLKGKIDHSTAGAQFFWEKLVSGTPSEKILAQILCLCLVSHHSGLIDCLTTDSNGTSDTFSRRIKKADDKTHLSESLSKDEIRGRLNMIMTEGRLIKPLEKLIKGVFENVPEKNQKSTVFQFQLGLLVRFLFSCLIDADRQDSADSEKPEAAKNRQNGVYLSWDVLIRRLETKLEEFDSSKSKIDNIRLEVSRHCLNASKKSKGLFTLTVPTGGGKTLSSLRFGLNHAKKHKLERIIYVIPFTSIIDQNADVVRKILETDKMEKGHVVLEHHSNIGAERQSWKEKLLTENWDAPVVYTTMVQFLETLFGSGTRGARRMHQLANSVIVFDEIQTLPIRCTHMFCNSINFLVTQCRSSVVLCTATQPLLGEVDRLKGALSLTPENEIMPDVHGLFDKLKRVEVIDSRKLCGWNDDEIAEIAAKEVDKTGSCLIIVNMKRSARSIFACVEKHISADLYHLSTGMCPAHRKKTLETIRIRLDEQKPTLCVSTQLIEAGVDIDFGSVIRFTAGLDSIAQAAGRCNRNSKRATGHVYIVNPKDENIDCLMDIAVGKEKSERVLNDFKDNPEKYKFDPIGPLLLGWYYKNYFFGRRNEMDYPVTAKVCSRNDTLLNLLSSNSFSTEDYGRAYGRKPDIFLRQSFMTAGDIFKSIDAPSQSVIVKYGDEGKDVVNQLCSSFEVEKQFELMRKAQQYSVNLFPHEFKKLSEQGALYRVQEETEIFYLDNKFYSDKYGISLEPINNEEFLYA